MEIRIGLATDRLQFSCRITGGYITQEKKFSDPRLVQRRTYMKALAMKGTARSAIRTDSAAAHASLLFP